MTESVEAVVPHHPVVGVVGPADLVKQIIELGAGLTRGLADWCLAGIAYTDEHDVAHRLSRATGEIDACLFAGPLPYDLARRSGVVTVPSTYIPLSGAALHSTLLRATLTDRCDVSRVSVDTLCEAEITDAYQDIDVPVRDVHVMEYRGPESPGEFVAFHERLWREGRTTLAVTSAQAVAHCLAASGVPVLLMRPTTATIRESLRAAALLGVDSRLEETQVAIGIVELPPSAVDVSDPHCQHDRRLAVYRALWEEARRVGATVVPRDEDSYYVVATLGGLVAATEDFRVAPFVERVRCDLGLDVDLGIGLGRTAREADAHARAALAHGRAAGDGGSHVVGHDGEVLPLPALACAAPPTQAEAMAKAMSTLDRLVTALREAESFPAPPVVDAGRVADLLAITPRTARRLLQTLAEMGLAWQLPPVRTVGPGRPRQLYRLMVEKLGSRSAT
ncbi:helix-turn-helix domain-containing protein [Streptoalloteichus hindustanus]|uniref:Transcriptional regulator n=1 Tax=Streptoalloteichus hindustanus TaxID=2017 RepID=A0A1M5GCB0_STRHI|nr:hypothetical protein [Streptoalloteichus hindustanus]SHG01326.1 hypothetical protein SAMN05444320_10659 [Streptoalloteichus hindustanus]